MEEGEKKLGEIQPVNASSDASSNAQHIGERLLIPSCLANLRFGGSVWVRLHASH